MDDIRKNLICEIWGSLALFFRGDTV